jgi:glycerol-3-phosphate dehydrogenase
VTGARRREAERARALRRGRFPVVIVGAGINGCGLFRELSLQGVDCLLVDRGDFCSGTSSAPSRLIHGGLKYLETGEFRLVAESTLERNRLLTNAAHLVRPLETVVPTTRWFSGIVPAIRRFLGGKAKLTDRGAVVTRLGLLLYDWYGRRERMLPRSGFISRGAALGTMPDLRPDIVGLGSYFDAWITAPERLGMELALDAVAANPGSAALTYTTLVGRQGGGILLRDAIDGAEMTVEADLVVNAAGPWIDGANRALDVERRYIGGTKGSHLLLDHPRLVRELGGRMVYFGTPDGRICLVFPFLGLALVGSTDIPVTDPDQARCETGEVDYMLDAVRSLFPGLSISADQIVYRYCGVRPLPASEARDPSAISRDHSVPVDEPAGDRPFAVLSLVGGKWTTFRALGEEAADTILLRLSRVRRVSTRDLAIGGGRTYPRNAAERAAWIERESCRVGLPPARMAVLLDRYGTTASRIAESCAADGDPMLAGLADYGRGEIQAIARDELVGRLSDVLFRRTTVAITGRLTRAVVKEAASAMGVALDWDTARVSAEIADTLAVACDRHGLDLAGDRAIRPASQAPGP